MEFGAGIGVRVQRQMKDLYIVLFFYHSNSLKIQYHAVITYPAFPLGVSNVLPLLHSC